MELDPKIWGPHYWFVFHTIALGYPLMPNDISKKKYYEFIDNIPLFIPVKQIGDKFSSILDKYPVAPYLDSRDSLIKWFYFIHNKINIELNLPEITMSESFIKYYNNYKPIEDTFIDYYKLKHKIIFLCIIVMLLYLIKYLYYI